MFHLCLRVSEVAVCSDNKHSLNIQQVKELDGGFEIQFISYKHSADSKPKVLLQPQKQTNYCPVVALRQYIKVRGQSIGPLFKDAQNKPVTRHCLLKHLRSSLELAGFDPKLFNTHSFRSGRATQLAADNVNDKTIKETGRWKSNAYLQYIRPSHFTLPNWWCCCLLFLVLMGGLVPGWWNILINTRSSWHRGRQHSLVLTCYIIR